MSAISYCSEMLKEIFLDPCIFAVIWNYRSACQRSDWHGTGHRESWHAVELSLHLFCVTVRVIQVYQRQTDYSRHTSQSANSIARQSGSNRRLLVNSGSCRMCDSGWFRFPLIPKQSVRTRSTDVGSGDERLIDDGWWYTLQAVTLESRGFKRKANRRDALSA